MGSVLGRQIQCIEGTAFGSGEERRTLSIPLVGALGGAAVNYAFIEHFQEVARGHFTVRRLERAYGKEAVRKAYERFAQDG